MYLVQDMQGSVAVSGQLKAGRRGTGGPINRKLLETSFPLISCINHSCLPNAHASWNHIQKKEVNCLSGRRKSAHQEDRSLLSYFVDKSFFSALPNKG